MYRTTKRKLVKRIGVTAVVALGVVGLGAAVASASPVGDTGQGCAFGDGGVVMATTNTSVAVKDPSGTTTAYNGASVTSAEVTVGSWNFAEGSYTSSTDTSALDVTSVNIGVGHVGSGHDGCFVSQGTASGIETPARHAR